VETAVGIVLIVLSLLIIVGIIRTVQANMAR
jgi:Na+-transporting methylmalonyl-CoA/oxaloacetate decarboxylase gamma subunit